MKLDNQNNAALILFLHFFFIAIGLVITYIIPSTENPTFSVGLLLHDLRSKNHSEEELRSWLQFLELPHEEVLLNRGTLTNLLDNHPKLTQLEFFSGIEADERIDFLASRLSVSETKNRPFQWDLALRGATQKDADLLFAGLAQAFDQKLRELASEGDSPIDIGERALAANFSTSDSDASKKVEFGKAFPPVMGALLAVVLVVTVWSVSMPSQRKLSFARSSNQLLIAATLFSLLGAAIGYLTLPNKSQEWECELEILVRPVPSPFAKMLTPEANLLKEKLEYELEAWSWLNDWDLRATVTSLIDDKGMTNWSSFKKIAQRKYSDHSAGDSADPELLRDYILDRVEIEKDPESAQIYTLRFRCQDEDDSKGFVSCLSDSIDNRMDQLIESAELGAQLAPRFRCKRLTFLETSKATWPMLQSQYVTQGAFIGAILTLVFFSTTRVLAGAPPI